MTEIGDFYAGGLLRCWVLVGGAPRCVEDAVGPEDISEEVAAAIIEANAGVRAAVEAVEANEAAIRPVAGPEPDVALGVDDVGGLVVSPARIALIAAADLIAAAGPDVIALAVLRSDEPE
ncbi:hypothetical protein RUR49_01905 [Pseudoxanthobacter sp. M-2]|uniref:hypothetical protein n=1 Tax=Pseudoxanthobacter sp. M-2 TaxID=3078754 RepID=UPI0038FC41EE